MVFKFKFPINVNKSGSQEGNNDNYRLFMGDRKI